MSKYYNNVCKNCICDDLEDKFHCQGIKPEPLKDIIDIFLKIKNWNLENLKFSIINFDKIHYIYCKLYIFRSIDWRPTLSQSLEAMGKEETLKRLILGYLEEYRFIFQNGSLPNPIDLLSDDMITFYTEILETNHDNLTARLLRATKFLKRHCKGLEHLGNLVSIYQ